MKNFSAKLGVLLVSIGLVPACGESKKIKDRDQKIAELQKEIKRKEAEIDVQKAENSADEAEDLAKNLKRDVERASTAAELADKQRKLVESEQARLDLLTAKDAIADATHDQNISLFNLDRNISRYLTLADGSIRQIQASSPLSLIDTVLPNVVTAKDAALEKLNTLESEFITSSLAIKENTSFRSTWSDTGMELTDADIRNSKLNSMRDLLNKHFELLIKSLQEKNSNVDHNRWMSKKIVLSGAEVALGRAVGSTSGFARSASGAVVSLATRDEAIQYARDHGFSAAAADSAYAISSRSGGAVRFADTSDVTSILDILAAIKAKLNATTEDLDLVFAIDYSGSMSNDIKAVIDGLKEITKSLQSVAIAGRKVRIGISLFGKEGQESIALNLTDNLMTVSNTLQKLLDRFDLDSHSDGPGEASFHGLELTVGQMKFSSKHPMIILITDEEAKEMVDGRVGGAEYVESVWKKLRSSSIDTTIYTILTH